MLANNDSLCLSTTKMMDAPDDRGSPDETTPTFQQDSRRVARWVLLVGIIIAALYVWFLMDQGSSHATASDASGYFNSAKSLSEGQLHSKLHPIPFLETSSWSHYFQQPLGYTTDPTTLQLTPTYPPGLPLQLLIASKIVGWEHAAILINVLSALLIGLTLALLGRQYAQLPWAWALAGVALLWACPLFVFFSLQPMSDMPSACWCLVVFYTALRSRQRWTWALVSGIGVGIAVLLRPTNILILLPVIVLLGFRWRCWLALGLAGLPFALFQVLYNLEAYGKVVATGYGDISDIFQVDFVAHNTAYFAHWIPQLLTPFVILACGLPWFLKRHFRLTLAIMIWVATLVGFYAFYYHSGETWWYLRFILPVFPFLILAALMVAHRLTSRWTSPIAQPLILALIVVGAVTYQYKLDRQLHVTDVKRAEQAYPDTAAWLRDHAPANAIMVGMQASGSLHYYTDFPLVRYDLVDDADFALLRESAIKNGQPIYAPLFPFEISAVVKAHLGGQWEKVATIDYITIWKLKL